MRYSVPILLLTGCSVPDLDNIHLAECMHACDASAHFCLDSSRAKFTESHDVNAYINGSQTCALALMDCIVACVDDAQRELK